MGKLEEHLGDYDVKVTDYESLKLHGRHGWERTS